MFVFNQHNFLRHCIDLFVYVDDIVTIIGSNQDDIQKLKQHLFHLFQTKDLANSSTFWE